MMGGGGYMDCHSVTAGEGLREGTLVVVAPSQGCKVEASGGRGPSWPGPTTPATQRVPVAAAVEDKGPCLRLCRGHLYAAVWCQLL